MKRARKSESFSGTSSGMERQPHLVFVHVDSNDGTWFSVLLTRVPCQGEFIHNDGDVFKVVSVHHSAVDIEGRSRVGVHAMIDVELQPEPVGPPKRRKRA